MTHDRTPLALTHVTVIDVTGGPSQPDQTVLVVDGTIAAVGPEPHVVIPPGARIHDLSGRHVLPGLTDMHVHSESAGDDERHFPAVYIANGVTTVREMWGKPYLHEWRRRTSAGEMLGPRSFIAGPIVDGSPALWEDVPIDAPITTVTTEAEARRAVSAARDGGADFVKVYSRLEREPYFALLREAARQDMTVVGHRSDRVPLAEQIGSGQRSFEHVHGLWPATSDDVERLEAAMARISPQPGFYYADWFRRINEVEWESVGRYSPASAAALFERMVAEDVAYCPTLTMHAAVDLPEWMRLDDERLAYMTPDTPAIWSFVRDQIFHGGGRSADEAAKRRMLFDHRRAAVAAMDEAGVRLLAGTDAVTPGLFPGFALHDELEFMVGAGLTPMRALQTATLEPARFLGCERTSGTVEPGKAADLVILSADPLADIRNTRRIHAVVAAGRYVGPDERRRLLETAADIAAATPEEESAR
ncbi:Amidohydrolase family protein [Sinosporangium album]|uniref:Amidohydrolase family protein n=1 Tax=Sinosporangium album TaxID=504805 RepID=A0A1G8B3T0_9ACTN|nr:amidohydrolase family protein [Sinosporangium album]SDH27774.1 Amidohydrolase family protein [Sinosporangium album]